MTALRRALTALSVLILPLLASACSQTMDMADGVKSMVMPAAYRSYSSRDRECLMRAMFFESNRSSRDGLIAVGTVVMNRLRSGKHGSTICEVVGERRQFAPGVMTRKMNSKALPDVEAAADAVLKGERSAKVKNAMFFHTAGLKFPYKNMHYTLVAGGNAFYEKRNRKGEPVVLPDEQPVMRTVMVASAESSSPPPSRRGPIVPARADGEQSVAALADAPQSVAALGINGPSPSSRPAPIVIADQALAPVLAAANLPDAQPVESADGDSPPAAEPEAVASFSIDPDDANAIGAMISGSDRPAMGFN